MKTLELQNIWISWLSAADKLTGILHEQTVALTLRDINRIERLQPNLNNGMKELRDLDAKAIACATELAVSLGVEPNVRSLASVLEKAEASRLQELANKVIVTTRNLSHLIQKNRTLIENELTYVNGTLTLIAKTAEAERKPLRSKPVSTAVLMDQAA